MMRRSIGLAAFALLTLSVACSDDVPGEFDTNADSAETATGTGTGTPIDIPAETGESGNAGDGDGDPAGDGDGEPTTGDGDGDPTTGGGTPECGNGAVEPGEQCDGLELNGIACTDLGYSGGDLACDPVTCTYDASGCTAGTDGGSGGTTG